LTIDAPYSKIKKIKKLDTAVFGICESLEIQQNFQQA